MLTTFLFWNVNKQPLQEQIANLAETHSVDVLMLAECAIDPESLLAILNRSSPGAYRFPFSLGTKIRIFTRFNAALLVDFFNDPIGGLTVRRLHLGEPGGLLLAVLHYPSRVNWDREDQTLEAPILAQDIGRAEETAGVFRTILVGDFNMNPFDPGVVGAQALHAVMTKQLARREERDVRGRPYRFFYNPMWGFFGDRTGGPPGTYYLHSSKPGQFFWNMYDQVLVRPALIDNLVDVQILTSDGSTSLLTPSGKPSSAHGSDHLPLLFQLDL